MATFTFNALPGDRLQIATMFGQSNDWFYAFGDGGLELFDDDTPVSGNVTSSIVKRDKGDDYRELIPPPSLSPGLRTPAQTGGVIGLRRSSLATASYLPGFHRTSHTDDATA